MLIEQGPVLVKQRPDHGPDQITSVEALTKGLVVILHKNWPPVEKKLGDGRKVIVSEEFKDEVIILGSPSEDGRLKVLNIDGESKDHIYLSTYAIIPENSEKGLWNTRYWIESTGKVATSERFKPDFGPDQIRDLKQLKKGKRIWVCHRNIEAGIITDITKQEAVILKEPYSEKTQDNQKIEVQILDRKRWMKKKTDLYLADNSLISYDDWSWNKVNWLEPFPRDNKELTPEYAVQQFKEAFSTVFKLLGHEEGEVFAHTLVSRSSEIRTVSDNFLLKISNQKNSQIDTILYFYPWDRKLNILLAGQAKTAKSKPLAKYLLDILEIEKISKNSHGDLSFMLKEGNVLTLEESGSLRFQNKTGYDSPFRHFRFDSLTEASQ